MSSLRFKGCWLFALLAVWLLVLPATARGEADITISIVGVSPDGRELPGEGVTTYTVEEVPAVHPGEDRALGTLHVTTKPGYESQIQPGARIKITLPPGTCYMSVPTPESYGNYVVWPRTAADRINRIADSADGPGIKFVAATPRSLTVEVGNINEDGNALWFDFIFNREGFSTIRLSPLVESMEKITAEPQGSVSRYEFFKWLTDVTLPFASCPLVIDDLSESRYEALIDLDSSPIENDARVRLLIEAGIITGYPGGRLEPNQPITRAEAVSLIGRIFPGDDAQPCCFQDKLPLWAAAGIAQACERGIVVGYPDGSFRPAQLLTRSEALTMLQKMMESYSAQSKLQ